MLSGDRDEIVDVRRDVRAGYAIDMERDRGASRRRGVAQLVNCPTPRADKRYRALRPFVAACLNRTIRVGIPRKQRFRKRSFNNRISAPRVMAMYRARLTGLPDERGDGIAPERIGDQQMPSITIQPAFTLGIG